MSTESLIEKLQDRMMFWPEDAREDVLNIIRQHELKTSEIRYNEDEGDIRQLVIEAIESIPESTEFYISRQADAIMDALRPYLMKDINTKKAEELFEAYCMGDSYSGRTIGEDELFSDFLPKLVKLCTTREPVSVDLEALDIAGYKRGFQDCEKMIKEEPWRFKSAEQPDHISEALAIITAKLSSAKKNPVVLSWDDAETIKEALSAPSE